MEHPAPSADPAEPPSEQPASAPPPRRRRLAAALGRKTPTRRPDASMTLLREVMEHPLDPGYALAARRRAAGIRRSRPSLALTVAGAMVCGLAVTQAVVYLRQPPPGGVSARRALEREVERRTREAQALQRANAALQAQIVAAQQRALAGSDDSGLAARALTLSLVSGELPVAGPGLRITVNDSAAAAQRGGGAEPRQDAAPEEGRVLDRDLQVLVNGLWAVGAEAIAINAQRLSPRAAIRAAGQAIFVDYRPLVPPYVIEAIGDGPAMESAFAQHLAGQYLRGLQNNFGVRATIARQDRLRLTGAAAITLRHARAAPATRGGPGQTASPPVATGPTPATSPSRKGTP